MSDTAEFAIDPGHSQLHLDIDHLGLSVLSSRFVGLSGWVRWRPAASALSLEVQAPAYSGTSGIPALDALLLGPSMLDATSFPAVRLSLPEWVVARTPLALEAKLMLRGLERDCRAGLLAVRTGKNRRGADVIGVRLELVTARSDFGMDLGIGASIGDEIKLLFNIEAKIESQ